RSGVWIAPEDEVARKVCAIGMRVSQRATMHGFALNCDNDLSWVNNVIPCGIDDAEVTTLSREAGRRIAVADVCDLAEQALTELVSERTPPRRLTSPCTSRVDRLPGPSNARRHEGDDRSRRPTPAARRTA